MQEAIDHTEPLAEEQRREARRTYETILKTTDAGFWICDTGGRIVDVNESLCQMLGYTRQKLLSMTIPQVEAVESPEDVDQHIRKIVEEGYDRFDSRLRRKDGTLLCFYRHNPSTDPYARLGHQDMTSHVDFTSLIQAGREHGLEPLGLTSQGRFLTGLGIAAGLERQADSELPLEEYYARRRAVTELIDHAGLGRIKVLIQGKGIGQPKLPGLEESEL